MSVLGEKRRRDCGLDSSLDLICLSGGITSGVRFVSTVDLLASSEG
jgi:hypothetical protein